MKAVEFQSLCRSVSKELGLKDLDSFGKRGEITLDEVAISVASDETRSPGRLDVLVDMGEIDAAHRVDIYEAMLAMNLGLDPAEQGALALDVDSNHALLTARVEWKPTMNAARLAEMLRDHVSFARQFRDEVASLDRAEPASLKIA